MPIVRERFPCTSETLRRDLNAMVNHLRGGGVVGFCLDHAKAVARFAAPPAAGATTLTMSSVNPWAPWNTSATLASGDEIRIEQPGPVLRAEEVTYTSTSGVVVTMSKNKIGYTRGPVLVRYRDMYPVLRLPAELAKSPDLLTHDRRRNYTLSLPLVEYYADLWAFHSVSEPLGSTSTSSHSRTTISADAFLASAAAGQSGATTYEVPDVGRATLRHNPFSRAAGAAGFARGNSG